MVSCVCAAIDHDSVLSAGDGLSTGGIIGIAFGAVTAVLGLLHIIRLIGTFFIHICVESKKPKQSGKYYYDSQ